MDENERLDLSVLSLFKNECSGSVVGKLDLNVFVSVTF